MMLPDQTRTVSGDDYTILWRQWAMTQAITVHTVALATSRPIFEIPSLIDQADVIFKWVMVRERPKINTMDPKG